MTSYAFTLITAADLAVRNSIHLKKKSILILLRLQSTNMYKRLCSVLMEYIKQVFIKSDVDRAALCFFFFFNLLQMCQWFFCHSHISSVLLMVENTITKLSIWCLMDQRLSRRLQKALIFWTVAWEHYFFITWNDGTGWAVFHPVFWQKDQRAKDKNNTKSN